LAGLGELLSILLQGAPQQQLATVKGDQMTVIE
jgi:hypothetical protein